MPKLSNARRHRRQTDLAGYCVNQTLRKVSEEDIQEQASSSLTAAESTSQDTDMPECRPILQLKRREPSTCLSDLCFRSPMPSACTNENQTLEEEEHNASRTISPAWGHFVDVILDEDTRLSPTPFDDVVLDRRAHSPYGESARKRLRLRSPQRPSSKDDDMEGFILQDPATLGDAMSRLSV